MTQCTQPKFNMIQQCRYGVMLFNGNDWAIGRHLIEYGEWAQNEMNVLQPFLSPGNVVVDAGANIGAHTLFFAQTVGPQGHVHAFEPQRIIFQTLCGNMAINHLTHITCHPFGLSNEEKTMSISPVDYFHYNNPGMAHLEEQQEQCEQGELVHVKPLDSLSLKRCDLIKADVEQMEKQVLEGAAQTISTFRPVLYMEINNEKTAHALLDTIWGLDYQIYHHVVPVYNPDNFLGNPTDISNGFLESNILCLPKEKLESYQSLPDLPIVTNY